VCWVADNNPVLLKNGEILISFAIDVNNNSVTNSQNDLSKFFPSGEFPDAESLEICMKL
jgi:hypothetical protein